MAFLAYFFCWLRGGHRWNHETVKVPKHLTPGLRDGYLRVCSRCVRAVIAPAAASLTATEKVSRRAG